MSVDYEPLLPVHWTDPYETYRRLRDEAPVHWAPRSGLWCVSRYEDVAQVLCTPEDFSSVDAAEILVKRGLRLRLTDLVPIARFMMASRINPLSLLRGRSVSTALLNMDAHRQLHELYAAMHDVREAERMRIARELHDELAQWLTALKMDVSWLATRLPASEKPLVDRVQKMKQLVDTMVGSVRRIAADLRPVMLDDLGLTAAVEHLVHEFSQRTGLVVSLDLDPAAGEFRDPLVTAIYRMVQEALTNVARHAQATEVRVSVRVLGEYLKVAVGDNGKGVDSEALHKEKSYGLRGIRERARTLGGSATIGTGSEGGTLVEIEIPAAPYRSAQVRA